MTTKAPFIILTNGRSGSNYLVNLLNKHPAVLNYGEVLGDWTVPWTRRRLLGARTDAPADVEAYLDGFFKSRIRFYAAQAAAAPARLRYGAPLNLKRWANVSAIGIKDFQINFDRRGIDHYLMRRPKIRVIILRRADPVRRFISSELLNRTGQVAVLRGETAALAQLNIDPDSFLRGVERISAENAALDATAAAIASDRKFEIEYTTFFNDAAAARRITTDLFRFLGLAAIEATSEHHKLNTRPLSETLANYPAVAERLQGTPFEAWLDRTG